MTKSITRFARNTVVLLEAIRELKDRNIDVYFEKEDMHSRAWKLKCFAFINGEQAELDAGEIDIETEESLPGHYNQCGYQSPNQHF